MEATDMQDLPGRFVLSHVSFSARVATILKPDCHIAMHLGRIACQIPSWTAGIFPGRTRGPGRTRAPGHSALHA